MAETVGARPAWDAVSSGFDRHAVPVTMPLVDALVERLDVGRGTRFLEVAAGRGALTVPAARRGADVVAVDVAAGGRTNLGNQVMDGPMLDLPDGSFDIVASLNGVSLLADVSRGLREMVRVTKPRGRVMVAAFGPPPRAEFLAFFLAALESTVRRLPPAPVDAPLPFPLAEPEKLLRALAGTGLKGVNVDRIAWPMAFSSGDHLWDMVTANPIGAELVAHLTDGERTKVRQVLHGMLRDRSGGRPGANLHTELNVGTGTK